LNDNINIRNYQQVMENIQASFESILPEKSSFEIAATDSVTLH
jgi:hypothetical protein